MSRQEEELELAKPRQVKPRKRMDPRRETTRQAILEAAETLFAEQGIDAVSLRQIGAAIGAGNTAVVAYHFGDKEALIEAILRFRLPDFERRRAELAGAWRDGEAGIREILEALWLPLFEQRNAQGRRSYAAFLASFGRSGWGWVWTESEALVPVTVSLATRLQAAMPPAARPCFMPRVRAVSALITAGIQALDLQEDLPGEQERVLFDDLIRMAAAALGAPGPANQQ
ncbi:TetR/AcrR family transcriptional regulator [Haliea sp. E17]|uniref:TetR/AcrR family transcriptional regulator n=1 Tax=Haliea sp. E17 TaxID=3401576 RepID=UPI003AAB3E6B